MKRKGFLFEKAFSYEALFDAWVLASKGKRTKKEIFKFSKNLDFNLRSIKKELDQGIYKTKGYKKFSIKERNKIRIIYAPYFRDLVVQHAIYKVIYPIFDPSFIDQSYACRKRKGTHAAGEYAQAAIRKIDNDSYILQLDIKKFFYTIDRKILKELIIRKIKDEKFVNIIVELIEYDQKLGIPIGNLLSQILSLVYLNPLDHFIKRSLKAKIYCRYMDDFIIFGLSNEECLIALEEIEKFIDINLSLKLSRFSLFKAKRGLNFVGYRTWKSRRFIRKHSMFKTFRNARKCKINELISGIGHSRNTATYGYIMKVIRKNYPKSFKLLPKKMKPR